MDRGAWRATIHGVAKGQTRLSGFTFTFTMEACSLPDASIHGNFQARILEWLSFSSPRGLPSPGIEPGSPALQAELYPLSHKEAGAVGGSLRRECRSDLRGRGALAARVGSASARSAAQRGPRWGQGRCLGQRGPAGQEGPVQPSRCSHTWRCRLSLAAAADPEAVAVGRPPMRSFQKVLSCRMIWTARPRGCQWERGAHGLDKEQVDRNLLLHVVLSAPCGSRNNKNNDDNSNSRGYEGEVAQSCPTLCDPMDCSLPGSSLGFSRQECWSGLPFPSLGDLPDSGIEPGSLHCRHMP